MIIQLGMCKRCGHRSRNTKNQVCAQCRQIATIIVESCAMNLAMIPLQAFEDSDTSGDVLGAVRAAHEAFTNTGVTPETIAALRTRLHEDIQKDAMATAERDAEPTIKES